MRAAAPFTTMLAFLAVGSYLPLFVACNDLQKPDIVQHRNTDTHGAHSRAVKVEIGRCHSKPGCTNYAKGVAGITSGNNDVGSCVSYSTDYGGIKVCAQKGCSQGCKTVNFKAEDCLSLPGTDTVQCVVLGSGSINVDEKIDLIGRQSPQVGVHHDQAKKRTFASGATLDTTIDARVSRFAHAVMTPKVRTAQLGREQAEVRASQVKMGSCWQDYRCDGNGTASNGTDLSGAASGNNDIGYCVGFKAGFAGKRLCTNSGCTGTCVDRKFNAGDCVHFSSGAGIGCVVLGSSSSRRSQDDLEGKVETGRSVQTPEPQQRAAGEGSKRAFPVAARTIEGLGPPDNNGGDAAPHQNHSLVQDVTLGECHESYHCNGNHSSVTGPPNGGKNVGPCKSFAPAIVGQEWCDTAGCTGKCTFGNFSRGNCLGFDNLASVACVVFGRPGSPLIRRTIDLSGALEARDSDQTATTELKEGRAIRDADAGPVTSGAALSEQRSLSHDTAESTQDSLKLE